MPLKIYPKLDFCINWLPTVCSPKYCGGKKHSCLFTQSDRYVVNFVSCNTFRCRTTRKNRIDPIFCVSCRTIPSICRIV
jgi:hypothetical protein